MTYERGTREGHEEDRKEGVELETTTKRGPITNPVTH